MAGFAKVSEAILEVSPNSFTIENSGGTEQVNISSNINWSVTENSNWLSIVPPTEGSGNGSFSFVCSANGDTENKTASIAVTGPGISETIDVTLLAANYITVSPPPLTCEIVYTGYGICVFDINSNIEWTATKSGDDFFSFEPGSGIGENIEFTITGLGIQNDTDEEKQGIITISGTNNTIEILVTQLTKP